MSKNKIVIERFNALKMDNLLGFIDIKLEPMGLILRGISVHQKNDGSRWFNMPSQSYQDKQTGEKKYSPYIYFSDKEIYKAFTNQLHESFKQYVVNNNIHLFEEKATKQKTEDFFAEEELPF